MTNNENIECYLCKGIAQAVKIEAEIDYSEEEEVINKIILPICYNCEDENYDGTEEFPGTVSLSRLA